eukprot:gene9580-9743_t
MDQASKRAASHERYKQLLGEREAPFSFHDRDKEAAAAKAAARTAARDPNRFQTWKVWAQGIAYASFTHAMLATTTLLAVPIQSFKAKPVPAHVHEARLDPSYTALEATRLAAKVKAEMARERAADKLQEAYRKRQELAEAAYKERLAQSRSPAGRLHSSPTRAATAGKSPQRTAQQQQQHHHQQQESASGEKSGSGRRVHLGQVPNFSEMHASFAAQQAAIKAANNRRVTVPQEFQLNGSTPEERAAREQKQAKRRARIITQIQQDDLVMTELRWPYASSRAPVKPTPPPLPGYCDFDKDRNTLHKPSVTLAAELRAQVTRQAMAEGRFDSLEIRQFSCRVGGVVGLGVGGVWGGECWENFGGRAENIGQLPIDARCQEAAAYY